MKLQSINQTSFNGYNARPLRGFLMRSNAYGIADEMYKIGQKEGFKVFMPRGNTIIEKPCEKNKEIKNLWTQDYWTIVKDKLLALNPNELTCIIQCYFNLKDNIIQTEKRVNKENKECKSNLFFNSFILNSINSYVDRMKNLYASHIAGGNIFIMQNSESVIVGNSELQKYSKEEIQKMYDAEDVIVLPQMDYHLDLFIRPLDKKRVLLADDNMMIKSLEKSLNKIPKDDNAYTLLKNYIHSFQLSIEENSNSQADEIEEILQNNGFEVIRVPARIYNIENNNEDDLCLLNHDLNYINANVLLNKNDELVYITNKSNLDSLPDLSFHIKEMVVSDFEESFIDAVSAYIKPEHIYFVNGDDGFISKTLLPNYQGGIHCTCSEVP